MKKKILLISGVLLTLSILMIIIFNNMDNKENNIISNINKDTEVINSNMITMMYETDAGTGIYEETKDTTWPESGYIFNENLSGCENGGELEYNSQNNTVNLLSNKSDNCYVYFDKYDGVWIDNVSVTNVTGSSITLDINATSENGSITTYYYSLNDNEEYQETTTNPITINDLNTLTEYKISIYAIDSTNARSNIYELTVTTTDESGPVINSVSVSNVTYNSFTLTVDATSDVGIKRYHYIIESENIAGTSTSNSYTFNALTGSTIYNVSVFVIDNNDRKSKDYNIIVQTDSPPQTLAAVCSNSNNLAACIKEFYNISGTNVSNIYYHDANLTNGAGDNSYRYSGANPDNFVCFGSTAAVCPNDNLYRIIGVFDNQVKLIKYDYVTSEMLGTNGRDYFGVYSDTIFGYNYKGHMNITSVAIYRWNYDTSVHEYGSNNWATSEFNNINLNINFINYLGDTWASMISTHDWKIGGGNENNIWSTPQTSYNYEVGSNSRTPLYNAKIGLMYVSDYGYAASPDYWTTLLQNYNNAASENWIYMGLVEGVITPLVSSSSNYVFNVSYQGMISYFYANSIPASRPVFYLNSNVTYSSGSGTSSDPIRLEI